MIKKLWAILLVTLLILSLVAGCSAPKETSETNGEPKPTAEQSKQSEEPTKETDTEEPEETIQLTYLTSINVDTEGHDINDNPYVKYIEEMNNIDLNIISESTSYNEKVNAVMASGDLPDYLLIYDRSSLSMFANDGLIIPLDDYIKNAPNLLNDTIEASWKFSTVNDSIYAIPMQRYDRSPLMTFVRKDWIENLGIDLDSVRTVDDHYNMLKAFVEDDPDGNGEDDTFGLVAIGSSEISYNMYQDALGGARYQYIDGELRPNYILDGYKEWLKFMNKLYEEKILDTEYIVNTSKQNIEKTVSGKYGMFKAFWSIQEHTNAGIKREDLLPVRPPVKADGTPSHYLYASPVRHYIAVTKDCKYPQKVVDLMEWACTDEGSTFVHAGIEGWDYDLNNGEIVIKEERRGKNWAWRFITMGVQKSVVNDHLEGILKQSWGELGMQHLALSDETGDYDELNMYKPFFPELADYDLDSIVTAFRDKAIIGQINIDAEWDNFVATWRKSGGNEWIRLHTEWYENEYNK